MNLAETIYLMNQRSQQAAQMTDLRFGTVTSVSPLAIQISANMEPLRAGVLVLTSAVVERKIPALTHSHQIGGLGHTHTLGTSQTTQDLTGSYESDQQLSAVSCIENGVPLPSKDGFITLNRALAVGDRVLLLRVQNGQKFIVLSRVFEGG